MGKYRTFINDYDTISIGICTMNKKMIKENVGLDYEAEL